MEPFEPALAIDHKEGDSMRDRVPSADGPTDRARVRAHRSGTQCNPRPNG